MGKVSIRKFSYLDYDIEIIRERKNLPDLSKFEPRLGIQVRYGLKFDGQITDWTDFVEATDDEPSANILVEMALRRVLELQRQDGFVAEHPAA